jgi:HEPN domain-containing protein
MRRSAPDEGRRWLEQAEEDLRWAKDLAERGGYHIACFLAQQVGEKALNGEVKDDHVRSRDPVGRH